MVKTIRAEASMIHNGCASLTAGILFASTMFAGAAHAQSSCAGEWMPFAEGPMQIRFLGVDAPLTIPASNSLGPACAVLAKVRVADDSFVFGVSLWDGASWRFFDAAPIQGIGTRAVALYGHGEARAAYFGGGFRDGPAGPFGSVLKWDGKTFALLENSVAAGSPYGILTMTSAEVAGADWLVVGGEFTTIGDMPARNIAAWDGAQWHELGDGLDMAVLAVAAFDDGTGPAIYASGWFRQTVDGEVSQIARWRGSGWEPIGFDIDGFVESFAVVPPGGSVLPGLYAAGQSSLVADPAQKFVFRWTGSGWEGVPGLTGWKVRGLEVMDDGAGDGPAIFAVGNVDLPNATRQIAAKWNGAEWSAVGYSAGQNEFGYHAASFPGDSNNPAALFVLGDFETAPSGHRDLAVWTACVAKVCADVNGDGVVNFADLNAVLASYGLTGKGVPGDINGNGAVDFNDLNIVLTEFGADC